MPERNMSPAEVLNALASGHPVVDVATGIFRDGACRGAVATISERVIGANGAGPRQEWGMFWIIGGPGNGKTQTLLEVGRRVCDVGQSTGNNKFVVVHVDFSVGPTQVGTPSGLQAAIVQHSLAGNAPSGEVFDIAQRITLKSHMETAIGPVSLGIDVLSALAGCPVGLGTPTGWALKKGVRFARLSKWYIKRALTKRLGNQGELLELLLQWSHYVLRPTSERKMKFDLSLRDIARSEILFDLYCYALEQAGYASIVIFLDEVRVGHLELLRQLWERPLGSDIRPRHRLNIFVVCAAEKEVFNTVKTKPLLCRRLAAETEHRFYLRGPSIPLAAVSSDDFEHVRSKIQYLFELAQLPKREVSDSELNRMRKKLSKLKGKVKWDDLWRKMYKLYKPG